MSSGEIRPVTHLIFDIDGLLLDSESVWTRIMEVLLEPYGVQFNWDIKLKMMGKKENEAGKMLIDMLKLPITVEEYMQKVQQLQAEMMPDAKVMPGIERLIDHLVKHKVPIAVATGNSEYEFNLKEKGHSEFFKKFQHKVLSGSDPEVIHGKPAPDCFLVCAKRFPDNPDPGKVLVFEDAPNGVEGAMNAGMQVVWIPDPKVDKALCQDKATLTLNSATEFKPELFGLSPYDS